jgi:6-phosphogluconolactonase
MLWRLGLLLVLLTARAVAGVGVATFYVGTYTDHSESQGIYVGTIDTITGRFGALKLAAPEKNPNFLAISPDHQYLFAALSSAVASYKIQSDSTLKPITTHPISGSDLCHVAVDRTGHVVFAANYGGGSITSMPVDDDGKIGLSAATEGFTGSGPNPQRQKKPFAHEVVVDPVNAFVYACDLGTDSIWSFKLGPGGVLTATNPPAAKGPRGGGTRHLVFNSDGSMAYVVNEMGVSTSVFSRNASTGALTLLDTESNVWPGDPAAGSTAAEIVMHPSGKWLYVSNRNPGHDSIAVFAINAQGGIKLVQSVPSPVKCPRSIAVDPTGHWVIAAGQTDNTISVLQVDPATGHLSLTETSATVGSPVCVLFVPDEMLTLMR